MKSVIWWQSDTVTLTYRSVLRALFASCFEWRSWEVRLVFCVWPGKLGCQLSHGPSDAVPTGSGKWENCRTGFLNNARVISLKQGTDTEEAKLSLYFPTSPFLRTSKLYISEWLSSLHICTGLVGRGRTNYRWKLLVFYEEDSLEISLFQEEESFEICLWWAAVWWWDSWYSDHAEDT